MGKVIMSGIVPQLKKPVNGILASNLAVGSTVKLLENGSPVEYLVVNQGIPSSSSLYDSSCDGTWLLRKDIRANYAWDATNNDYGNSSAHVYVNEVFIKELDVQTQEIVKQVKIPFVNGTGGSAVVSGSSGLSTKLFLLGGYEVGWTTAKSQYFPVDGACLDYFNNIADDKRIAYLNGTADVWWLRSPDTSGATGVFAVHSNGNNTVGSYKGVYGIRPALILPFNALFDNNTLILKGVA